MLSDMTQPLRPSARLKLLEAARTLIRTKGFAATTVDDLCLSAGVTKGAFFHHFASKEALGVAAAEFWQETTGALFAASAFHARTDPFDRIMAYLDLREALLTGGVPDFTCLAGTLLQEVHQTSPAITGAAYASVASHAATLEQDFAEAVALYRPHDAPDPLRLALYTQVVLQGAFILAKGQGGAEVVRESIGMLRQYLVLLFQPARRSGDDRET
jgi:TetR/AcrR family transcriptional repressor of nem operon